MTGPEQHQSLSTPNDTPAKAVVAASVALSSAIATALADGKVTIWELALGILGALIAGGTVWATSNEPSKKA